MLLDPDYDYYKGGFEHLKAVGFVPRTVIDAGVAKVAW
jgi:hypothetical protein